MAQHELEQLKAIVEYSGYILSAKNIEAKLDEIVHQIKTIFSADGVSLMLMSPRHDLHIAAATGLSVDVIRQTKIALGERVAGRVAVSREPLLLIDGLEGHQDFREVSVHRKIHSSIVHPLVSGDQLVGVLNVSRSQTSPLLNHVDKNSVGVLGGFLAVALERTLVHEQEFFAIGRFAADLAHHLRNSLTIILSHAQSLIKNPADKFHVRMTMIQHQAVEANRLVTQMLKGAVEGQMANPYGPVPVKDWIEVSGRAMSQTLHDRSISLEIQGVESSWIIYGDRQALDRVVMNILMNAVQAMPDGGSLTIRGTQVSGEQTLRIEVCDSGVGIASTTLDRLFEPFMTTKPDGIGLGLYSIKQTVEAHGGRVEVESVLGQGTKIRLILPLLAMEPASVKL